MPNIQLLLPEGAAIIVEKILQNLSGSNTDVSFTTAVSNLFLCSYDTKAVTKNKA